MTSVGEVFKRVLVLVVLALLMRGIARVGEWMGVAEVLTLRQAGVLACGLVLLLWVLTGKVTE